MCWMFFGPMRSAAGARVMYRAGMDMIAPDAFTQALRALLAETFENVQGYYLDGGNSLFETLGAVSAAQASIPVGGRCATLAAQVKHTAFYLDVFCNRVLDPNYPEVNWGEIWSAVREVTPAEWDEIRAGLRGSYARILQLIAGTPAWGVGEMSGAMAIVAHCAYHLGEIRQALCTLDGS